MSKHLSAKAPIQPYTMRSTIYSTACTATPTKPIGYDHRQNFTEMLVCKEKVVIKALALGIENTL